MGKPVARVGDFVFNAKDTHFVPPWGTEVSVPVVGIILVGSDDTFTNDRANAIADPDKKSPHVLCPGANEFAVKTGSDRVFTNDFPQGRSGDETQHCGSNFPGTPGHILPLCSLNTYA